MARAQGERAAEERRRRAAENLAEAATSAAKEAEAEAAQAQAEADQARAEVSQVRQEMAELEKRTQDKIADSHRVQFWRQTRTDRDQAETPKRQAQDAGPASTSPALALRSQLEQSVQSLEGALTRARITLIELASLKRYPEEVSPPPPPP